MKITINLLPLDRKEELQTKRLGHRIIKISVMLYGAILVFVVFLFGCLQIIDVQKKTISADIQRLSENKIYRQAKQQQELIKEYYQRSVHIEKSLAAQKSYWEVLTVLNGLIPEGVDFNQLKIESKKITLKGTGESRERVIEFRNSLEKSGIFGKVISPISNFTQEKGAPFEFNLELK